MFGGQLSAVYEEHVVAFTPPAGFVSINMQTATDVMPFAFGI
jgi:hypothetical protein